MSCPIFERARFNRRSQEPGESAESFIMAVYSLAEHCAFGNLIRDRIVVGLQDANLSESLWMDLVLTLAKTVAKLCHHVEIKKQQPILRGRMEERQSGNVDAMTRRKTQKGAYGKKTQFNI